MSLIASLFKSGLFTGGLFNGGLFANASATLIFTTDSTTVTVDSDLYTADQTIFE